MLIGHYRAEARTRFLQVFTELNPTEDCEHLMTWAQQNPKDYHGLVSKLFPQRIELSGPDGKPIERRDVREDSQAELHGIIDLEG